MDANVTGLFGYPSASLSVSFSDGTRSDVSASEKFGLLLAKRGRVKVRLTIRQADRQTDR